MRNETQLSIWIDSDLKKKFDSLVNEVKVTLIEATKKEIVNFLINKWNNDKQLREEFMEDFRKKHGKT